MSTDYEGHKVKITCDRSDFAGARVWLDGTELRDLTAVSVGIKVGEMNTVKLELMPEELDVEVAAEEVEAKPGTTVEIMVPPEPGQVVLVRPSPHTVAYMSAEAVERLRSTVAELFPDNKVIVVPPGVEISTEAAA